MRASRYILIVLVAFVAVLLLWFFRPLPPSGLKGGLYSHAYLAGMVQVHHLWDRPLMAILSSFPETAGPLPSIPFFLRPLFPPVAELYLFSSKEGGGWVMAVDLGWRSRLFKALHGFIMRQIQYRGFGAVEGENTIRTPSGRKFLVYQDAGTLFVAEGEVLSQKIPGAVMDSGAGLPPELSPEKNILSLSLSNKEMAFEKVVKDLEEDIGFLLLPSADSLMDGTFMVRYAGDNSLAAEIVLGVREGGDMEGVEGDVGYLLDLLDRFLSTHDLKTGRTIRKEGSKIMAQLTLHPNGGTQ
jgi:hypothetical protein